MVMSCRTDTAAEMDRRMTVTAGPRRGRALTATWLISIVLFATLQTTSAHETAIPDPHTDMPGADWVIDAWRTYASKFISPDGRVIDDANGGTAARRLHLPRVGVYKSYLASMDEGWLRYVLEQFDVPYAPPTAPASTDCGHGLLRISR